MPAKRTRSPLERYYHIIRQWHMEERLRPVDIIRRLWDEKQIKVARSAMGRFIHAYQETWEAETVVSAPQNPVNPEPTEVPTSASAAADDWRARRRERRDGASGLSVPAHEAALLERIRAIRPDQNLTILKKTRDE